MDTKRQIKTLEQEVATLEVEAQGRQAKILLTSEMCQIYFGETKVTQTRNGLTFRSNK